MMRIGHDNLIMFFDRLCITAPYVGGPTFQAWEENIFRLTQRKGSYLRSLSRLLLIVITVPIIVVYTKFDLFMANNQLRGDGNIRKRGDSLESAERYFYSEKYSQLLVEPTKNIDGQIPYTIVSSAFVFPVA